jgi:hypothetical protein
VIELGEAISHARVIVFVLSSKLVNSTYVQEEYGLAFRLHKKIIPARIENVNDLGPLQFLLNYQDIDFTDPTTFDQALDQLRRAITIEIEKVRQQPPPAVPPPGQAQPTPPAVRERIAKLIQKAFSPRYRVLTLLAFAALFLSALLGYRWLHPPKSSPSRQILYLPEYSDQLLGQWIPEPGKGPDGAMVIENNKGPEWQGWWPWQVLKYLAAVLHRNDMTSWKGTLKGVQSLVFLVELQGGQDNVKWSFGTKLSANNVTTLSLPHEGGDGEVRLAIPKPAAFDISNWDFSPPIDNEKLTVAAAVKSSKADSIRAVISNCE